MIFNVWVSRRFWPWPKLYKCKGMEWCSAEQNLVPSGILLLILEDEKRVWVSATGRIITYGREFYEWQVQKIAEETGKSSI